MYVDALIYLIKEVVAVTAKIFLKNARLIKMYDDN